MIHLAKCFNIIIIDTYLPDGEEQSFTLEKAQASSPRLRYEGGENKFFRFFKSSLDFTMEVPSGEDAFFSALFTGDEKRYRVELWDDDDNVYWRGFLLPDQYSEPFTPGGFFVTFQATDGLQSLNGVFLGFEYYNSLKSVPQLIGACLRHTGLDFNIAFDPAIQALYAGDRWHRVFIDGEIFSQDSDRKSAYDILDTVLTALGAYVVQYQDKWMILGLNKTPKDTLDMVLYNYDGVFISDFTFVKTKRDLIDFERSAGVMIKPPIKRVLVNADVEYRDDIVPQLKLNPGYERYKNSQASYKPLGWERVGSQYTLGEEFNVQYLYSGWNFTSWGNYENQKKLHDTVGFTKFGIDEGDYNKSLSHYISFKDFAWVTTKDSLATAEISFEIPVYDVSESIESAIKNGDFHKALKFELLQENERLISSFREAQVRLAGWDYEFTQDEFYTTLSVDFEINNINFITDGFLTLNIHLPEQIGPQYNEINGVNLTKFSLSFNKGRLINTNVSRPINFTKTEELSVNIISLATAQTNGVFYLGSKAPVLVDDSVDYVITYINQKQYCKISLESYHRLLTYQDDLYYKINSTDSRLIPIDFSNLVFGFIDNGGTNVEVYFSIKDLSLGFIIGVSQLRIYSDKDFVEKFNAINFFYQDKWRKSENDSQESRFSQQCIAELYLDAYAVPQYAVEGVAFDLYNPLDIIHFSFDGDRTFTPLRLDNNLDTGDCNIYMIEDKIVSNTDYEYVS